MKILLLLFFPFLCFSQDLDSLDYELVGDDELFAICWVDQKEVRELNGAVTLPIAAVKKEFGECMCMVKSNKAKTKMAMICLFPDKSFTPIKSESEKDAIIKEEEMYFWGILADEPLIFWIAK